MKMLKMNSSESGNSDSASLLISILLRFPQIGTVKLNSKQKTIWFDFMLSQDVKETEIELFRGKLLKLLNAYHYVIQQKPSLIRLELRRLLENYTLISVGRDVASLSRGEISLIISSLNEEFSARLITDDAAGMMNDSFDELGLPDELIDSMLENLRMNRAFKNLTALRENGRVLIFNK